MDSNIILSQEQQFDEVINIILQHQSRASRAVNEETLLMAWNVGGYISNKLKTEEWGSKVVTQLSEYIRTKQPCYVLMLIKMVVEYAMSRSMSPTLITEYKRILIPQERMQEQLNEYCNLFLEEQNGTND